MRVALTGVWGGSGGIQTHLRWLSRALTRGGHSVLVLSLEQGSERAAEAVDGVSVCYAYAGLHGPTRGLLATRVLLKALREFKPEIYIGCGTGLNVALPGIFTSSNPVTVFHEVMSGEALGWRDPRWLVRWWFDAVVAQAEPVADTFAQQFGWVRDVPVLAAFPEPLELVVGPASVHNSAVRMGHARAAVFGRLVPHKNVYWLVQQWPYLSAALGELHIYGCGPEENRIRSLIAAQGWQDAVVCHGAYPAGRQYLDLLSSFDLTLLPTVGAEGAPLVLLESMACGVPFVATDAGGISDYANEDCIVVSRSAPEAFLEGVRDLTRRMQEGRISRARLRQFYLDRYSFRKLSHDWLTFLESLASTRGARAVPS